MAYNPRVQGTGYLTPQQRLARLNPRQAQMFRQYIAGVTAKPPTPVPQAPAPTGAGATFVLPGSAEAEFGAQRANIGETYTEETAMNQYKLRNAQIAHNRQVRDEQQQYDQARAAFPDQYINRGIMGRGVYTGDLQHFNKMRLQQEADTRMDYTRNVAGLRLTREGIERRRNLSLANNTMRHQAALSDAASRSIK